MAQLAEPKKRKLTVVRKSNDPVEVKPPLSEEEIEAAAKAAADEQLSRAILYKNLAIDCMACSNIVGIKALLGTLETWQPSASTLRASGLPIIFHDIKFWEDANLSARVTALRNKFRKVMRETGACPKSNFEPFLTLSHRQFRQAINNMIAHIRGSSNTVSDGIHRRLAYHLVMRGFTLPQTLEGLNVEACKSFACSIVDVAVLSQAIAMGTAMASADREKIMGSKIF